MTKLSLGLALAGCSIVAAITINAFFSVEREAETALRGVVPEVTSIRFGIVRARGVICGEYEAGHGPESHWHKFKFVSHYSALSPPKSFIVVGDEGDKAFRHSQVCGE